MKSFTTPYEHWCYIVVPHTERIVRLSNAAHIYAAVLLWLPWAPRKAIIKTCFFPGKRGKTYLIFFPSSFHPTHADMKTSLAWGLVKETSRACENVLAWILCLYAICLCWGYLAKWVIRMCFTTKNGFKTSWHQVALWCQPWDTPHHGTNKLVCNKRPSWTSDDNMVVILKMLTTTVTVFLLLISESGSFKPQGKCLLQ